MWHGTPAHRAEHTGTSPTEPLGAIWFGAISVRGARRLHATVMLLLAAVVLFTPAGSLDDSTTQLALSVAFPDARFKARESAFPMALGISYSLAFITAWLGALSVCFTQGDLGAFHQLVQRRSLLMRIVVVLGMLVLSWSPFEERHVLQIQVSWHVNQAIEHSRWVLLVVCEGLYIGIMATMAWVLYEITNGVNAALHAVGHPPRGHGPGHP